MRRSRQDWRRARSFLVPRVMDERGEAAKIFRRNLRMRISEMGGHGLFQRTAKKCPQDPLQGGLAGAFARTGGLKNKFAAPLDVPEMSLGLQNAQQRADGRARRRIGQ